MRGTTSQIPFAMSNISSTREMSSAAGATLEQLAVESPHVDVVRYEHKNVKFTLQNVDVNSSALAYGLLESGLKPGNVVLSWLPSHFAEEHVLQFACSKAGLILYNLDPSLATSDPSAAKAALESALQLTNANVLITQEAGSDVKYVKLVESVIPEVRIFNVDDGMPFFTPRFPHLRLPIHTGFDYQDKAGMVPLHDILCVPSDLKRALHGAAIEGSTPLKGELIVGKDGIPTGVGKVMSNNDVIKSGAWPEFSSILKKEYREVSGVGNVW
jgi:hypothetical protein